MTPANDIAEAARAWNERDIELTRGVAWNTIPYVGLAVTTALTGSPEINPTHLTFTELAKRYPAGTQELCGIAIACGDMTSERDYFEHRTTVGFAHADGFDVSDVSLAKYVPRGITFSAHTIDVNEMVLPEASYDLAVGSHGLHHIANLSNCFSQLHRALKPKGLLYMYEWIGPEYLQLPRANRAVATVLLYVLFPRAAQRRTHEGYVKGLRWMGHSKEQLDPSEACNSTVLMSECLQRFRPLHRFDHGGLTYPMLEGIGQKIDQANPVMVRKLKFIVRVETLLTRWRLIKPLFTVMIAEKR
jgi:SAM-dependent methyltransferase